MSNKVDEVAKAIWHKMNIDNAKKDWNAEPDNIKFLPRLYARTALAALMNPTETMLQVGERERATGGSIHDQWIAMMEAALGLPRL